LLPIVRSTSLTCRYFHSWNPSSRSVIDSNRIASSGRFV
jgi:hypothetical protein